jgi:hypothetical protein
MQRLGFIHDMMDVKVLILYVMARANYPMNCQEIYEVCYQDECLSYFDVCTALPEMVASGHLTENEEKYEITEKGRQDGSLTEDSIAFTVRQSAENAIIRFNCKLRRSSYVKTRILPREDGCATVMMTLDDETGNLMNLELMAPNRRQAIRLSRLFEQKAEQVYNLVIAELLSADEQEDA